MRILSIYYTHKPGGFCKRLYRLLNALSARGDEVHYMSLDHPPTDLSVAVIFHRIPFPIRARSGLAFWLAFTVWCPLYLILKGLMIKPDRLVVFGAYYAGVCAPYRWIKKTPIILFVRSLVFKTDLINEKNIWLRRFSNFVDRIGFTSASKVICMTESMKSEVESFFKCRLKEVSILPNDIPPPATKKGSILAIFSKDKMDEITSETTLILTSGTLDRGKNIGCLLEAMSILSASFEPAKLTLLIAGGGPLEFTLKREVASRNLLNVKLLGWVDDLNALLSEISLVIHPSLSEGVSNSLLEALGNDVPVLASNTAEHSEIVIHEELLFNHEAPKEIANKIERFVTDQGYRQLIKDLSNARRKALTFDWVARACFLVN